jgi:uncharacterized protein (DUF302 family)
VEFGVTCRSALVGAAGRRQAGHTQGEEIIMVFEETVVLTIPFAEAVTATKTALAAHGFGVLTEIDMQHTLKAKVDKDMDAYVILGACNPKLASAALDVEPHVGVLLPCNVVVREVDGTVHVDALDPGLMVSMTSRDELAPIAAEARRLIGDALASLAAGVTTEV